jgi:hypothetical protein
MKLADLRRLAIRKQLQIHFRIRNGMECVVSEDGVAHVPALKAIPDFNLEEELASASEFLLEPVLAAASKKGKRDDSAAKRVGREELARMMAATQAGTGAGEHEEE